MCWIGDDLLAVSGIGTDDPEAAELATFRDGVLQRWTTGR
jgi:hypothetical protein